MSSEVGIEAQGLRKSFGDVEALCGHVWVPSRDPKQLPLCQECKSIYEMYKSFNGDLPEQPNE